MLWSSTDFIGETHGTIELEFTAEKQKQYAKLVNKLNQLMLHTKNSRDAMLASSIINARVFNNWCMGD
ncbi:hypothetical protein QUF82_16320 [Thiotrichales bacterium HSG14]|nr:hypothetical protein [Thiotrichales bacterium HSG14]